MGLLYALSYTIKMTKMGAWQPEGYFDYTVPPLEGLWWTSDESGFDGRRIFDKSAFLGSRSSASPTSSRPKRSPGRARRSR